MGKARDIASAAPAPAGVTSTELGYVDGVTSAIQTQINAKQAVVSGVNDTEIGYLDGVTSAIQTQINSKIGQSTAINPSTITAKGDLIVGTGSGTFTAQPVGTNGQLLSANSAQADGVEWVNPPASGGMTVIASGTLSGPLTISSIPGTYKELKLQLLGPRIAPDGTFNIRINGVTANYSYAWWNIATTPAFASSMGDAAFLGGYSGANAMSEFTFPAYASSVAFGRRFYGLNWNTGAQPSFINGWNSGITSAITSLSSPQTFTGGSYILYGIN